MNDHQCPHCGDRATIQTHGRVSFARCLTCDRENNLIPVERALALADDHRCQYCSNLLTIVDRAATCRQCAMLG